MRSFILCQFGTAFLNHIRKHIPDLAPLNLTRTSLLLTPAWRLSITTLDALGIDTSWSKDMSGAARMINARSETAHLLPAYRDAEAPTICGTSRWILRWKRVGETKQPYCFDVNGGQLFAFAALCERWKGPSRSFSRVQKLRPSVRLSKRCAF